jgi:sirohydrochlorin ferrochelatase
MAGKQQGTAVLIFAHGSSVEEANQSVHELARRVEELGAAAHVRAAFLDPVKPGMDTAIEEAVQAGFRRVIVVPFFLTMGVHLRRDLPALVAAQRRKHPQVEIVAAASLDDHPMMASIVAGRVREATRNSNLGS